jgi:hypothetical protein
LSRLEFVGVNPDDYADEYEDDEGGDMYDENEGGGRRDRHRQRRLGQQKYAQRILTDTTSSTFEDDDVADYAMVGSTIDIAAFHLPEDCASTRSGCDWIELGIGARSEDGEELRWCCSPDAVSMGLCSGTHQGRLILQDSFNGKHRSINVPATGEYSDHLTTGPFKTSDQSGKYVVVFANCNDNGRTVMIQGKTVWKSNHGYLPGDLFGLMVRYCSGVESLSLLLLNENHTKLNMRHFLDFRLCRAFKVFLRCIVPCLPSCLDLVRYSNEDVRRRIHSIAELDMGYVT